MLSYTERSSCPHLINRAWLWQIIGNQADLVFCRVDLGYKWACRWAIGGPHMRKQIRYVEGCHLTLRWAALQGLWLSLVVAAFCSTWIFVLNECELYWERLLSEIVGDRLISLYTHTHTVYKYGLLLPSDQILTITVVRETVPATVSFSSTEGRGMKRNVCAPHSCAKSFGNLLHSIK